MTFADVAPGLSLFCDANLFSHYFVAHATFGHASKALLDRIERRESQAYTSTHVLGEMIHRLMTVEACLVFGWPVKGVAQRMRNHPNEVKTLSRYRMAIDELSLIGIQVLPVLPHHVSASVDITRNDALLSNDALVVAVMRDQGLSHLASQDADFDRVQGLSRYSAV